MVTGGTGRRASPRPRAGAGGRERARLGRAGEDAAARHLESQGYRLVERNYRNRLGEIDIVATEGQILCFVEVKARRTGAFGGGLEAVEGRKRAQVRRVAAYYLGRFGPNPPTCRFDVVEVWLGQDGRAERVRLVRNAF